MTLSPIFPHNIKPVRVGVYEVFPNDPFRNPWYSYWDGEAWCFISSGTPSDAYDLKEMRTVTTQDREWRGIQK